MSDGSHNLLLGARNQCIGQGESRTESASLCRQPESGLESIDKYRSWKMVKLALLVRLEAKPGKESAVEEFLRGGLALVQQEPATSTWYAIKLGPSTYGIFDTFQDDAGRQAHLTGRVAAALMAKAPELLAQPPAIEKIEILAAKIFDNSQRSELTVGNSSVQVNRYRERLRRSRPRVPGLSQCERSRQRSATARSGSGTKPVTQPSPSQQQ